MKLLIVDDSKAMQMIVRRTLRQAGYQDLAIKDADCADKALEAIKTEQPDLVLSDWNMPGASGLELLKMIRSAGNHVQFGFITSEGSPEMRAAAKEAGAEFLISKPFTVDAFQAALGPVFKKVAAKPSQDENAPGTVVPLRDDGLPTDDDVRMMLSGLFDQKVGVKTGAKIAVGTDPSSVATYQDDAGEIVAVAVTDIQASAYLGCALCMVPAGAANEAVKKRALEPAMMEGYREVSNIFAAAFHGASGKHVKLVEVLHPPAKIPAIVLGIARKPSVRRDLAIEIPKYGSGRLGLLLR